MVVVRSLGTGHVFGGYTPLDWAGHGKKVEPTRSSFVFLLRATGARAGEPPQKWHPMAGSAKHICCAELVGPCFGTFDLFLCNGCDGRKFSLACAVAGQYTGDDRTLAGEHQHSFLVDDYEVFQVGRA